MPILETKELKKHFIVKTGFITGRKGILRAVDGVSLTLDRGETLGIVGESGCGKSTLARMTLGLLKPDSGSVLIDGADISGVSRDQKKALRKKMQVVFQNPFSSLNPRMKVGSIVEEPMVVHGLRNGVERREKLNELFVLVGLQRSDPGRYPHELSGGQRQRVCIARAISLNPEIIVCDEPVSALDVSIQAQILSLLNELQQKLGISYMFISHDLGVIRIVSSRVAVMYLGKVVESARTGEIFNQPMHHYTKALIDSVPIPDPSAARRGRGSAPLQGDLPNPIDLPSGCLFHTRCPKSQERCGQEEPSLEEKSQDHFCACHYPN